MDEDDLNAFRGLVNGVLIGLVLWAVIVSLIWWGSA